ncbi:MAG TPA: hypothetical protein VJU61_11770 [Polyangiaceae bacterium]|nr:hypothetical protein [Polyangiaceae bacterium]
MSPVLTPDLGGLYWLDSGLGFGYGVMDIGYADLCVIDGSRGKGQSCAASENCGAGLVCHAGYQPDPQCRPPSELGEPCTVPEDCASLNCQFPDTDVPDEFAPNQCAKADPRCDIRLDATCGYWLSCRQCVAAAD